MGRLLGVWNSQSYVIYFSPGALMFTTQTRMGGCI